MDAARAAVPEPEPDPSALCLQCGICCTDTHFARVELQPAEVGPLLAIGTPVTFRAKEGHDDVAVLEFPCPLWQDHRCSVYGSAQPRICAEYRCRLLEEYVARERSLDECLAIVRRIRRAEAEADEVWAPLGGRTGNERAGDERAGDGRAGDGRAGDAPASADGAALMASIELDVLVRRYLKDTPDEAKGDGGRDA